MHSSEASRRAAALILIAVAFMFAALGAWALVARSAIPFHLDGTVTSIDVREEKHPGVDDAWFVGVNGVNGDDQHLDTALAKTLRIGDTVAKSRWDTTMIVNGQSRSLHLSNDAEAMLLLAPAAILTCAALALPNRRARRPLGAKSPQRAG